MRQNCKNTNVGEVEKAVIVEKYLRQKATKR